MIYRCSQCKSLCQDWIDKERQVQMGRFRQLIRRVSLQLRGRHHIVGWNMKTREAVSFSRNRGKTCLLFSATWQAMKMKKICFRLYGMYSHPYQEPWSTAVTSSSRSEEEMLPRMNCLQRENWENQFIIIPPKSNTSGRSGMQREKAYHRPNRSSVHEVFGK